MVEREKGGEKERRGKEQVTVYSIMKLGACQYHKYLK